MKTKKKSQDSIGVLLKDKLVGRTEVNAPAPLSNDVRDQRLDPYAGTRHFIPRDEQIEGALISVEKLIRRGNYKAAVRQARQIKSDDTDLGSAYALMASEKVARALVAIGDRYLAKGDIRQAKSNYQAAVEARGADAKTRAIADATNRSIEKVRNVRERLIDTLIDMSVAGQYEAWCETRTGIQSTTILDHLSALTPDIRVQDLLGPRVPPNWRLTVNAEEGWNDPVAIDDLADARGVGGLLLERPVMMPGASFAATSAKPLELEVLREFSSEAGRQAATGNGDATQTISYHASSTFPLMASMMSASRRVSDMDARLNMFGRSAGSMPIFRYSYLIDRSRNLLTLIADTDSKMLSMQFELDDFASLIGPLSKHIGEHSAEIQALNTRINELTATISTLSEGEDKLGKVVQQLKTAEDDCDPEWWEYVISVVVVIGITVTGAFAGFLIGVSQKKALEGAIAGGIIGLITSVGLTLLVWHDREISCDNVSQARQDFEQAHSALNEALGDTKAELIHSLAQRDIVIAELASIQDAYNEALTANQARVLNARTLSYIVGVLDGVRRTNLLRAHSLALMAQDAYNAEHDTKVNIIAASHSDYLDEGARGYTAAAVLNRDLDGLEHIRITGHTRKLMQLTQAISLLKHYPSSLASILTSGQARFATRLTDFDRWFPGTYMQSLKEVRVEVFIDDEPQPIRGYLTNDGVSFVRFSDYGNYIKIDGRNVVAEPDRDLLKLCYKRRRRHHAVETMAFPSFDSFLYEARATGTQYQERNLFEGCGLESTWHLELMPDQVLEYARITDVKIHFQFEAMFDSALKRVVEAKRYKDRNETALVSVRKVLEERGTTIDFSQPIEAVITAFMFEAPHIGKTIRDVGLMLRPKQGAFLSGKAQLRLGYQEQAAIELETNEQGIVATADTKPAGTMTTALRGQTKGKSVVGMWAIEILDLPQGFHAEDIDDILLLIRYTFEQG